jgi:type II secretory ATPase GspE/PulE/Tfp pilus assembly ATPase PilB-like protein
MAFVRKSSGLPAKVGPALVARLKIMCNLDIAERRLPQDGRIVFKQYTKKGSTSICAFPPLP